MTNPFFEPSTLPFGLPPFAEIADEHYRPAFERGMAEHRAEIDAIVQAPDAATFANTLVALERSGQTLSRVAAVFFNRASADSDAFSDALEAELAPQLAAHSDAIRLNSALFARIEAVRSSPGFVTLDAESRYLVERYLAELTQAGAALSDSDKERLRALNQELSTLTTRFQKNLLADTNTLAVVIDDVAELDGLGAGEVSAAAQAAAERGLAQKWVVTLTLFSGHPYLSVLTNRSVRERIMRASLARGRRGGEFDNRSLVADISRLRAERAALLGFASHAALVTSDETARTPEAVAGLLERLAGPAARNARAEQAALQQQIGDAFTLEAWDWAFYSEKVRSERFDIDLAALRPYLEAENVLQNGVFWAAGQLYGVTFTERDDLVAYHPGARVFEVSDDDGSPVGLYVLDLYTRDSKRGGAWMNSLISQNGLLGHPVVVTNNLNVAKPADGTPTLLTFDEVTTLFHEFGHALHGLFARVTYPKFAGTSVFRDFVEFPSQVNEMWMLWPSVLAHYAVHHLTGEPLPAELASRLQQSASAGFNEGFATSEYLAAALLDQAWHAVPPPAAATSSAATAPGDGFGMTPDSAAALDAAGAGSADADADADAGAGAGADADADAGADAGAGAGAGARARAGADGDAGARADADADGAHDAVAEFEAAALAAVGLDNPVIPPRYSSTYFAHVFSGGYDAGYYSYIWSEVLDADTVEWFRENGGLTRANGDRFRQRLLGVGGSRDPLAAYRDFRGRDADIAPLLARRGLTA